MLYHFEYDVRGEIANVTTMVEDEYVLYRQNGGEWDYYPFHLLTEEEQDFLFLA